MKSRQEQSKAESSSIAKQVSVFNQTLAELQEADKRTFQLAALTFAAAMLVSSWGSSIGVVILGKIIHQAGMSPKRDNIKNKYQKQLNELSAIFVAWASRGPEITQHPDFLLLLKTISPFLWVDHLYPVSFRKMEAQNHLSLQYKRTLSEAPLHHIIFVEPEKKESSHSWFQKSDKYLETEEKKIETSQQQETKIEQNIYAQSIRELFSIFSYPVQGLKRWCYGYANKEDTYKILNVKKSQ